MRPRTVLAPLLVFGVLATACGVAFGGGSQGNEFFKTLTVTGNKSAGSPLTAALTYETDYPIEVEIACELRQSGELLKEIGGDRAPPYPDGDPDLTPFPGNFSIDFSVDAPGRYKVQCYTPLDEDNYIEESFTVS